MDAHPWGHTAPGLPALLPGQFSAQCLWAQDMLGHGETPALHVSPCLEMLEPIPKCFIKNVLGKHPVNPHGKLTFAANLCFLSNMIFSVTFMSDDFKALGLQFCSAQAATKPGEVDWELQLVILQKALKPCCL